MSEAGPVPRALAWTLRLLAGGCFFAAWLYFGWAFRLQSTDDYWFGVAFAGEAVGLLRRLSWARGFGLIGLAFGIAWSFWEQTQVGATVGGVLLAGGGLPAAWVLARYPQHFSRRWW